MKYFMQSSVCVCVLSFSLYLSLSLSLSQSLSISLSLPGFSFLSRCAGLLSRLVSVPTALEAISTESTYRLFCQTIAMTVLMKRKNVQIMEYLNTKIEKDSKKLGGKKVTEIIEKEINELVEEKKKIEEIIKYISDEQSHLIRTLASLTKISENCMNIAVEEKLVYSLLFLFPSPVEEIGEITPHSVILTPKYPAPAILLGNAARCLMTFGDDIGRNSLLLFDMNGISNLFATLPSSYLPILASSTTSSSSTTSIPPLLGSVPTHSVQRLINAMATCSDIRVRRNISIILAKGCRSPNVRAHVEKFRGLQIMVELQKLL